jgi:ketosteroid isomerase-like protein
MTYSVYDSGQSLGGIKQMSTRDEDRKEILAHVREIFEAFIRRDRDTIKRAHSDDWVGFLGPSSSIERGIDAYMTNVDKSLESFVGRGFELLDTELQFYDNICLVYYVARYDYEEDGKVHSLPLRSVDVYRKEELGWIQAGSHIAVIPGGEKWGSDG